MNIEFNRDDVRTKMTASMRVAMRCGNVDVAGNIAATMVNAFHAFERIESGEPPGLVKHEMAERQQMIANYFHERERETCVIEQAKLDNMTLQEYAEMRARLESL